ncbi:Mediator of RNA polymerase II transcription subunit 16 [Frankliniella fusca]|uniref:Mediator of RNA polymerase II transcription subunit 16 n=1 Tax=Frankliniella fusca TaxID=407009 RepID=A0AAE1HZM0_9NEOP|nr:Mediator of RNA polymerase II transcription subunit 16 [Frankliniella fusca]
MLPMYAQITLLPNAPCLSLVSAGVGIVLVTVSGVAWRLTSHDAPSCRVMLGMAAGGDEGAAEPNRRFVPRLPPSYGRPHHPYAAMMYPEFQYRPPPPSYQASMQEYRLRLLLLDRHPGAGGAPGGPAPPSSAVSPPPTYRSHAGSLLRAPLGCRREVAASEYSRPPSYRSRSSSTRPSLEPGGGGSGGLAGSLAGALAGALGAAGLHSRTGSVATEHSLSDAGTCPPQPVSVISVGGDSVKCDPDAVQEVFAITGGDPASSTLQMMLRKSDGGSPTKDTNLVTIVQTSGGGGAVSAPAVTQVAPPRGRAPQHQHQGQDLSSPVIVTVSGATTTSLPVCADNTEMEILAHL